MLGEGGGGREGGSGDYIKLGDLTAEILSVSDWREGRSHSAWTLMSGKMVR